MNKEKIKEYLIGFGELLKFLLIVFFWVAIFLSIFLPNHWLYPNLYPEEQGQREYEQ